MAELEVKQKIIAGRKAVDAYREAHRYLSSKEHTPLLNAMLAELKKQGFSSIQEFFGANEELDLQVFKECHIVEGSCCHECHGQKRGCLEDWYQKRTEATQNEALGPFLDKDEAYRASFVNPAPKHLPAACTYAITKIKEDIDWQWN